MIRGLAGCRRRVSVPRSSIAWTWPVLLAVGAAYAGGDPIVFNDNGGWCWFQDERAIVHDGLLVVGSVATARGDGGSARAGNIEVAVYDLAARSSRGIHVLHDKLESDDHDVPALLARPDGRILAIYARHGTDRWMRSRVTSRAGDPLAWEPEQRLERGAGVTYSNTFFLSVENGGRGRVYNFYRGEGWNPNVVVSDDLGETWTDAGRLVRFRGRPYLKYASNGRDRIHFVTTEHHPRNFDNSLYHGYIRDGKVHRSDGELVRSLADGPIRPGEATRIFAGDRSQVAWPADLHLDRKERPYLAYSVQHDQSSSDLRYRYARWDGSRWLDHPLAHAGTALYDKEADYSGLVALHPHDPSVVFVSTDADPVSGKPLISRADARRHYEIFRGRTFDGGATWSWTPITSDSREDNLRPIVPIWRAGGTILLWLRGTYQTYRDYDLDVVGIIDAGSVRSETDSSERR